MYEKYYKEIVAAIQKKFLPGHEGVYAWAQANAPELFARERALDAELNRLWDADSPPPNPLQRGTISSPPSEGDQGGEFEAFRNAVVAWGREVLKILKAYHERFKT